MYLDLACVKRIIDVYKDGDDISDVSALPEFTEEKIQFCAMHLITEGYMECDPLKPTIILHYTQKGNELRKLLQNDAVFSFCCDALSGFRNITIDILLSTARKIFLENNN